ncbi:MAG: pullulanase [Mycolicibacterium sp.]|uniref:pullulanase n=1 Tax=Mycolicibacterium sp. TaxID=2320850 RepID=UPI003D0A2BCA
MEYCLGEPDGSAAIWTVAADSDLDGDGRLDGLAMDVDGDGLVDDMLADLDDDGLADHAILDRDDDGRPEAYFTDDGTGTWAVGADRGGGMRWFGLDGVEQPGAGPGTTVDLAGDGSASERLIDSDRDGLADRAFGTGMAWVDTDGDGRWDVRLGDEDGDGRADSAGTL